MALVVMTSCVSACKVARSRCAKIYKEATQRSFRQALDYTENRKVKIDDARDEEAARRLRMTTAATA